MAKPTYVGGTSGSGTGASFTVSLNGTLTGGSNSSPSPGDLILVFIGQSNTGTVTSTCSGNTSGAYPTIRAHQVAADTYDANLDSLYRFAGATPDTTLTIGRANNTTYGCAVAVHVWRGVHDTTPFNVTPTIASATNGSAANPAAITPTVADSIVIYCGVGTQTSTGTAFTAAGTYPVTVKGDGTTSDVDVMVSSYTAWTSGAYDPAAFTGSTTTTACAWVAVTLTLQPAAVVDYPLTCNSGSYSYTGSSATISRNRALSASAGSYAYTGSSAGITKGAALNHRSLTASAGSYTYTGSSATLVRGRSLVASLGSYSYSGQSATINRNRSLTASSGSYAYTGQSATILRGLSLSLSAGSYTYTGSSADINKGLGEYSIVCDPGVYALTGSDITITAIVTENVSGGGIGHGKKKLRWIERDGKILIFKTTEEVELFIDIENRNTEEPLSEVETVNVVKPVEVIVKEEIKKLSKAYNYKRKLYHADQIGDIERVIAIYKELQQREEDDIEMLLIGAL